MEMEMEMNKYSVVLQWSDEDDGYIATVPEFPGVSAFGETSEEAVKEVEIALQLMVEVYNEDGCELPLPDRLHPFSGQTRLRMPKSLHAELSYEAKKEGVSLNSYITHLLAKRNEASKLEKKIDELKSILSHQILQSNNLTETQSGLNTFYFKIDLDNNSGKNFASH
jgi:predicted RNase H-like HicB family nuclease